MSEHTIQRFDEELDKLRSRLIKMGSLVQQQIEMVMKSFTDSNHELAKVVISNDDKIDNLDIKIDKQCLRIFALHQPVAMDLRLVMSAISINDTMELIGNLVVNIAKDVEAIQTNPAMIAETRFIEMSKQIEVMLTKVLDAFIYNDATLAFQAIDLKSEIKKHYKENFSLLLNLLKNDTSRTDTYGYLLDINRNMEFITDLALGIAQEVVFLVEAKIVKHASVNLNLESTEEPIII
jgi:phosphate transport system protein